MKNIIFITAVVISISGCASSTPPVCYNKAKIINKVYDIPIFKKNGDKYLAGYPFHAWEEKTQFIDTSSCDKLHP